MRAWRGSQEWNIVRRRHSCRNEGTEAWRQWNIFVSGDLSSRPWITSTGSASHTHTAQLPGRARCPEALAKYTPTLHYLLKIAVMALEAGEQLYNEGWRGEGQDVR